MHREGQMSGGDGVDLTTLLRAWSDGDGEALEKLVPRVRRELHRLAHRCMRGERPGHTLQTTALINEAYIRLVGWKDVRWQNRAHFFSVSAQIMRRILVDAARKRKQVKRGGDAFRTTLDEACVVAPERSADVVALDEALTRLAEIDPRKAKVVEMRFFAGLDYEEIAAVLGVSDRTVLRDWKLARAWLYRELER